MKTQDRPSLQIPSMATLDVSDVECPGCKESGNKTVSRETPMLRIYNGRLVCMGERQRSVDYGPVENQASAS